MALDGVTRVMGGRSGRGDTATSGGGVTQQVLSPAVVGPALPRATQAGRGDGCLSPRAGCAWYRRTDNSYMRWKRPRTLGGGGRFCFVCSVGVWGDVVSLDPGGAAHMGDGGGRVRRGQTRTACRCGLRPDYKSSEAVEPHDWSGSRGAEAHAASSDAGNAWAWAAVERSLSRLVRTVPRAMERCSWARS